MRNFLVTFCLSAVALVATAQNEPYRNPDLSPSERAWDLLKRMTLEEKISQMKMARQPLSALEYRHMTGGMKHCTEWHVPESNCFSSGDRTCRHF